MTDSLTTLRTPPLQSPFLPYHRRFPRDPAAAAAAAAADTSGAAWASRRTLLFFHGALCWQTYDKVRASTSLTAGPALTNLTNLTNLTRLVPPRITTDGVMATDGPPSLISQMAADGRLRCR